jgi:hypothetical protein
MIKVRGILKYLARERMKAYLRDDILAYENWEEALKLFVSLWQEELKKP